MAAVMPVFHRHRVGLSDLHGVLFSRFSKGGKLYGNPSSGTRRASDHRTGAEDPEQIARLAGHSHIDTTDGYLHIDMETLSNAVAVLNKTNA